MNLWDVAAGYDSSDVTVLLGDGASAFHPGGVTPLGGPVVRVATADFTGDGKEDVIAAVGAPVDTIVFLPNQGGATFGAQISMMVPYPSTFVTPDFNGDGKLDLFYTLSNGVLGAAPGTATAPSCPPLYYTNSSTTSLTAGDVNGEGWPDMLVTSAVTQWHGDVSVFFSASLLIAAERGRRSRAPRAREGPATPVL